MSLSRGHVLILCISALLGAAATILVHFYVIRPSANWDIEEGVFTIYLNSWVGQPEGAIEPPTPEEKMPNLERLCHHVMDVVMPYKCKEANRFDLWFRNGPWYPSGWPFLSNDHGVAAGLDEYDCTRPGCPRFTEHFVGIHGRKRIIYSGMLANWCVYSVAAFCVYWVSHYFLDRRAKARIARRRGFPISLVP
ncbi:hypothetical protein B7486_01720 [cyanobacterium TDX16]|nr:hypothetical protein B7486_01720 [cyanobacterium TDX16]